MANVLRKLQTEVFVFNLREPRAAAPQLSGFTAVLSDEPHPGNRNVQDAEPE